MNISVYDSTRTCLENFYHNHDLIIYFLIWGGGGGGGEGSHSIAKLATYFVSICS